MGLGWMGMEMSTVKGQGSPWCWGKGGFNSPFQLSAGPGLDKQVYAPCWWISLFAATFSSPLPAFFFFLLLTFMGKGLEGEASENTMN